MKKCTKCSSEIREESKFCGECGEKVSSTEGGDLSIADIITWQQTIKKDVDLNKLDEELTPEELAKKAIYLALDKTVEESVGDEKKKEIDVIIDNADFYSKIKENLTGLIELGKEIEKNLFTQKSYIIVFFEKEPDNHYKFIINDTANKIVGENSLTNSERIEMSEKSLDLIKKYGEKVVTELVAKQGIVKALLSAFENKISEIDFERYSIETDSDEFNQIKENALQWLGLTKELLPYRNKAIEAVKENLEMDEIVPKLVIKHNGDISKTTSGLDMFTKGNRMTKLINEASDFEDKVNVKRVKLSQWLFGKEEEYLDVSKNEEVEQSSDSDKFAPKSNSWKWVIVVVLTIVALSWGIWTAIGVFILGVIIMNVLSK